MKRCQKESLLAGARHRLRRSRRLSTKLTSKLRELERELSDLLGERRELLAEWLRDSLLEHCDARRQIVDLIHNTQRFPSDDRAKNGKKGTDYLGPRRQSDRESFGVVSFLGFCCHLTLR